MKQHLLNRCKTCGISWFPRGFDASGRCPNCGSAEVDPTGRFYLLLLAVIAVAAGVFWVNDRSEKLLHGAATPASAPATPRPRRIVQSTPSIPSAPVRITTEAQGKREALRLYPDLGVADFSIEPYLQRTPPELSTAATGILSESGVAGDSGQAMRGSGGGTNESGAVSGASLRRDATSKCSQDHIPTCGTPLRVVT